jgi:pantoate kinase
LDKPFFDCIEFLAKTERKSKKKMASELMELGLRKFMGEKIREYNKRVIAARQLEQEPELTRFIILLRKFAKEHGMDISKFI